MSESTAGKAPRLRRIRHKGRSSQVLIYLGKQLRFFINESDWKVLPMAAVIAALVGMVIRKRLFINMEGSLIGGFALTCMAIWNGCFNSIQAVCRERAIIKREHRSGMHITSYVAAHMIYQFLLCAAQTGLTMYVLLLMDVKFNSPGAVAVITPWVIVDIGITMLLISYASDMLSLFISSISHTTTGAMTIMPFVLIFQLVFSGGIIPLPAWSQKLSDYTISNYGIKAITSQSGYNELPMVTAWNTLAGMKDNEIGGTVTLGQVLDLLDSPTVEKYRDMEVVKSYTVGEVADILSAAEKSLHLRDTEITHPVTVGEIFNEILQNKECEKLRNIVIIPSIGGTAEKTVGSVLEEMVASPDMRQLLDLEMGTTVTLGQVFDFLHLKEAAESMKEETLNAPVTFGAIVDFLKTNPVIQSHRDKTFTLKTTVGDLLDLFGEEKVKELVQSRTAAAGYNPVYERSQKNIVNNWLMLGVFIALFALLSTLSLELIDKDKR